jgi:hypothetical protein
MRFVEQFAKNKDKLIKFGALPGELDDKINMSNQKGLLFNGESLNFSFNKKIEEKKNDNESRLSDFDIDNINMTQSIIYLPVDEGNKAKQTIIENVSSSFDINKKIIEIPVDKNKEILASQVKVDNVENSSTADIKQPEGSEVKERKDLSETANKVAGIVSGNEILSENGDKKTEDDVRNEDLNSSFDMNKPIIEIPFNVPGEILVSQVKVDKVENSSAADFKQPEEGTDAAINTLNREHESLPNQLATNPNGLGNEKNDLNGDAKKILEEQITKANGHDDVIVNCLNAIDELEKKFKGEGEYAKQYAHCLDETEKFFLEARKIMKSEELGELLKNIDNPDTFSNKLRPKLSDAAVRVGLKNRVARFFVDILMFVLTVGLFGAVRKMQGKSFFLSRMKTNREKQIAGAVEPIIKKYMNNSRS